MWIILWAFGPSPIRGQESSPPPSFELRAKIQPADFGFRFDDNVFRAVSSGGRLSDEIYLLNLGGEGEARWDIFSGNLGYQFGADQYQL